MAEVVVLHGARILMPQAWEDVSIFRFEAPVPEEKAPKKRTEAGKRLQPNLVVTRHPRVGSDTLDNFLPAVTSQNSTGPTPKVLGSGPIRYLDQDGVFLDSVVEYASLKKMVFQRHLAFTGLPNEFVLVTITGTDEDVKRMSLDMGIEVPAANASQ